MRTAANWRSVPDVQKSALSSRCVATLALSSRLLSVAFPVRADAPLDFIATESGVKLNLSSVNRHY